MVLFTHNHKLQKFNDVAEIFHSFCLERYEFYNRRKLYKIKILERQIRITKNRLRFLQLILSNELILNKYNDNQEINHVLEKMKFQKDDTNSYTYLLNIPIRQMTKSRIVEIENEINNLINELNQLNKISLGELWKCDINKFKDDLQKNKT